LNECEPSKGKSPSRGLGGARLLIFGTKTLPVTVAT
jgi:hypothetical protein